MTKVFARLTAEHTVIVLLTCVGLFVGARQLDDNSMLVHLRTGIDMFPTGPVPSQDNYSFSAQGEPWIVQSWLPAWIYGALHAAGGYRLVIALHVVLYGLLAFTTVLLARGKTMVLTGVCAFAALLVGVPVWSSRPLVFGFLSFALCLYVVERRRSPLWLVPIAWVWINSHGSFPVGLGWLVLALVGSWLDGNKPNRTSLRYIGAFLGGIILGLANPVGVSLLTFWTAALNNSEGVFGAITEWRSPDFHTRLGMVMLVGIALNLALLARHRATWRYSLPAAVFLGAMLWSVRYAPFLSLALAVTLRNALKPMSEGKVGERLSDAEAGGSEPREPESRLFIGVGLATALLVSIGITATILSRPAFDFSRYPVAQLAALQGSNGALPPRTLTPDWVGCYQVFRDGVNADVFIDDRYDLYPSRIAEDYVNLSFGKGNTAAILERYDFQAVVWEKGTPLDNFLRADEKWQLTTEDKEWVVFVPVDAS